MFEVRNKAVAVKIALGVVAFVAATISPVWSGDEHFTATKETSSAFQWAGQPIGLGMRVEPSYRLNGPIVIHLALRNTGTVPRTFRSIDRLHVPRLGRARKSIAAAP